MGLGTVIDGIFAEGEVTRISVWFN